MLTLNILKPSAGARKTAFRVGRGQGSGAGSTAGRGNNGDKARSGARYKAYFEGGQTPLTRRTPKRGFASPGKNKYQIVNLGDLEKLETAGKEITAEVLYNAGLVDSLHKPIKILGGGVFTKNTVVKADSYSKSVREKLKIPKAKSR
jgi:large subunit ribosomal protein L15